MYGVAALLGLFGYFYRPKRSSVKARNVEFVIPSVADERTLRVLRETVGTLHRMFPGYRVWVVVDEGCRTEVEGTEVVVVPRGFRGRPCKGRALEYFRQNYVRDNVWYVFLDDDSYPLDDHFLYEIPYYEGNGHVAGNGILTPRNGRSRLCYILDHLRYWDDLFVFRFTTGLLGRPYIGLHGELLMVHGSILREITFTDSITEDFNFAQKLVEKGYRTWQSRTRVSIKSPNSLRDLWGQRARWIKGILIDLRCCRPVAFTFIAFRLLGGLASSLLLAPLWLLLPAHTPLAFFGEFATLYYITSYIYGIARLRCWRYLALLPVLGAFEPVSLAYIPKTRGFTVIDKN